MSEIKVSQMPEANNINDNDLLMIIQGGYNKKIPKELLNIPKKEHQVNVGLEVDEGYRVNILYSRNLIKPTLATTTNSGITITNNGDGTYTVNGTASATVTFSLLNNLALTGEYKLIGCPAGGSAQTYYMFVRNSAWSKFIGDTGEGKTGTIDTTMKYVDIVINEGTVCNNLVFKPMITKDLSLTYADFEPYVVPSIKVDNEEIYNSNLMNYSTNEQRIGTWIDGKPLYRKVVVSTNLAVNTNNDISISNIYNIKRIGGYNLGGGSNFVSDINAIFGTDTTNHRATCFYISTSNVIRSYCGSFLTSNNKYDTYITIEYTKTTD